MMANTTRMFKEAMDRIVTETVLSGHLRLKNGGLPYAICEVTTSVMPDPFPCITVKYWPNGKGLEHE